MEPAKNQPSQEASLHFLDYWRIIRIRKTIIITVFLITTIIATVVTFLLPASYASTARIKIENDSPDITPISGGMSYSPYDAYYIQTEFEIMQSELVLGRLISKLNLNEEWGKKYNGNTPLKTDETMELLKGRMRLSPERNTKLIDITIYSEDRDDAARLANGIAEAYRDYRTSLNTEHTTNGISVLEQGFQAEDEQIQAMQTNVDFLRTNLNIVDFDPNSVGPSPTISQADLQRYNDQKIERESTYVQDEKKYTELTNYDKVKLRDVLPTISPDVALSDLLSNLHLSEQKLVQMTNDLGLENPQVINLQSLIDKLNSHRLTTVLKASWLALTAR
jgi:succinoglycan biosynthesis transport protein ExoP